MGERFFPYLTKVLAGGGVDHDHHYVWLVMLLCLKWKAGEITLVEYGCYTMSVGMG